MNTNKHHPPRWANRLLLSFLRKEIAEEVEGDLEEQFIATKTNHSLLKAKLHYWFQVIHYLRPFAIRHFKSKNSNFTIMFQHYFKISWRNLLKHKGYSLINISGLGLGIAVVMLIALWVHHETSYNKHHVNHDRIAQIMLNQTFNGTTHTEIPLPRPIEPVLREEFGHHFNHVIMSGWTGNHLLSAEDIRISKSGNHMQAGIDEMLGLEFIAGNAGNLANPDEILLSLSTADALFGTSEVVGKIVTLDKRNQLKVVGVYKDIPNNSTFRKLEFIAPWALYVNNNSWIKEVENNWFSRGFQAYVEFSERTNLDLLSENITLAAIKKEKYLKERQTTFIFHPMNDWHLRSNWENGVKSGGKIQYVYLFQIIGAFVLFLACINFMNLSTARAEKRAKEIGIRKSVGSLKNQLAGQFLNESLLMVVLSFCLAIGFIILVLPFYNDIVGAKLTFPWASWMFWIMSFGFILLTAFIAGSYPAFYLSSFDPIKSLKGTLKAGKNSVNSRRILVVTQFTVSISLVIGSLLIFQQIQHTKNRPIGYDNTGLIQIPIDGKIYNGKYKVIRQELLNSGYIQEMSASAAPLTNVYSQSSGFEWEGKPEDFHDNFATISVSHDYGNSIQWEIKEGRDFSAELASDSNAVIINETAASYMGMNDPVGKYLGDSIKMTIIGVVNDMVMESPFQAVKQTLYFISANELDNEFYNLRLNPDKNAHESIAGIEEVFKNMFSDVPFSYQFVDEEYSYKFENEERIGKLSVIFTVLAIFISCLGLFGLASFIAEQRTKELGIRKILGASILQLWNLQSKEFVILVFISCVVAAPIAFYFMNDWLLKFHYRIDVSWWIFALSGGGSLLLTLVTISFQAIKAALINPVKSLRSE